MRRKELKMTPEKKVKTEVVRVLKIYGAYYFYLSRYVLLVYLFGCDNGRFLLLNANLGRATTLHSKKETRQIHGQGERHRGERTRHKMWRDDEGYWS